MTGSYRIRSEHIGKELLLIDFADFAMLSDHPVAMGGTGRGPMPGQLLKGALAASAVLAIVGAARAQGIALDRLKVACGSDTVTERREDGPLPSLTILSSFILVAAVGAMDDGQLMQLEQAVRECPLAQAIASEIAIAERNTFQNIDPVRDARSSTFLIEQMQANRPLVSDKVVRLAKDVSSVAAEYIGDGRVLLRWAGTSFIVAERVDGDLVAGTATPEELLLAALAACTSVFSARAGAMVDVPVEIRVACSGEFPPDGPVRIDKEVEFVGMLNPDQRDVLGHCADNCAIGETLRRPSTLDIRFERIGGALSSATMRPATSDAAFAQGADAVFAEAICDDGSCCVPELPART